MFQVMKTAQLYLRLAKAIEEAPSIPVCQTTDPEIFFPEPGTSHTRELKWAVSECKKCPVQRECAEYAIASNEPYGLWGGLSPRERQQIRSAGIGRPKLK